MAIFLFVVLAALTGSALGQRNDGYELKEKRLSTRFDLANGRLKVAEVVDRSSGAKLIPGEAFSLQLRDGRVIAASQMKMNSDP